MRTNPTKEQVKKARGDMTQVEAAKLIGRSRRYWQNIEGGINEMHWALFDAFKAAKVKK